MNNYYLLIYLNKILKRNLTGGEFLFAISPHKDVIEFYINHNDETHRLILATGQEETAFFIDPYRPPKKQNVLQFFSELEGRFIEQISLASHDRLLTIHFKNDFSLLFKLYGHGVNAFLVKNNIIVDAFKNPEGLNGKKPPSPREPYFANEIDDKTSPKNQLSKLNPLLPRKLLKPLVKQHAVDKMNASEVKQFEAKITAALLKKPQPRVLKNGEVTLWGEELLMLETKKSFKTVNEAIRFAYRKTVHLRRLHNKKDKLILLLQKQLQLKEAQLEQLLQCDKSLERAETYKKYGHLLMTKAHERLEPKQETIRINDIFENNEPLNIAVKSDFSIAENAESYYKKADSAKRSYQNAKQRIPLVKKELEVLETLNSQLEPINNLPDLNKWIKQKEQQLQKYGHSNYQGEQPSSPYRKYMAGKYEIWIGKSAKSNDELTNLAHKEDIWLHARGVGGSHTVIRMGNQKGYPPKEIILQAASYAAYYSKAKGTKIAPVIYTKRKYIHKPKGANPGTVIVDREQVMMVPPKKPE